MSDSHEEQELPQNCMDGPVGSNASQAQYYNFAMYNETSAPKSGDLSYIPCVVQARYTVVCWVCLSVRVLLLYLLNAIYCGASLSKPLDSAAHAW